MRELVPVPHPGQPGQQQKSRVEVEDIASDNRYVHVHGNMVTMVGSFVCLSLLFLLLPDSAWALQSHGPPEGMYIHQMAHVFFFGSLVYLYRDLSHSSIRERGWHYLRWFCLLMLIWNIVAFIGHAVTFSLSPEHIDQPGSYFHCRLLGPMDATKILFYITRFDHLLVVPALFFLYLGLRTLYVQVEDEATDVDGSLGGRT